MGLNKEIINVDRVLLVLLFLAIAAAPVAAVDQAPTITSITSDTGANNGMVSVTIRGTDFRAGARAYLSKTGGVNIGSQNEAVVSPTEFTCTFNLMGAVPGSWNLKIRNIDGTYGMMTAGFTITDAGGDPIPTITSITPDTGVNNGVVSVTIRGTDFRAGARAYLSKTGSTPVGSRSEIVVSSTEFTCTFNLASAAPGFWNVKIRNSDETYDVLSDGFSVTESGGDPAPAVTSITPDTGINNGVVSVTIRGTDFRAGARAYLSRTGSTTVGSRSEAVVSPTEFTCTFNLAGVTTGSWHVSFRNLDGTKGVLRDGFTVTSPEPPIFGSAATNADGTVLTITFDKAMADPTGEDAAFSYEVNGGGALGFSAAALNADPTKIDLTTAAPGTIVNGDTVTVSYDDGTGDVESADGGVLTSFRAESVINNVPVASPEFVSAETNADGSVITITFDKAMADPTGEDAAFSYEVNGRGALGFSAAALNADPTKIDMTTAAPGTIVNGDTVSINYNDAAGTVTSEDGGVLVSFVAESVTNNVPADPPVFGSAATNADGTVITITFDKAMADPTGEEGAFSYQVNGGGALGFSGAPLNADPTKIDLFNTAPGTIVHGDTVTVSYSDATGSVTSADGGVLASFIAEPVTNNVPVPPPEFVSAATNADGTVITITFDKEMADPAGEDRAFSYKVNFGSDLWFSSAALNANPTKIDLTTENPGTIAHGDTVRVSYNDVAGDVQSADGGVLDGFLNKGVTNSVP